MESENRVTIKFSGQSEATVLKAVKKVKQCFPLYSEGKIKPNDKGDGVHMFLKIALGEEA